MPSGSAPRDFSSTLAVEFSLEHRGKTYRIKPFALEILTGFENWCKQRAVETLQVMRPTFTPEEYVAERDRLIRSFDVGDYQFFRPICQAALQTPQGGLAYAALHFGCPAAEILQLFLERGPDIQDLLARVRGDGVGPPAEELATPHKAAGRRRKPSPPTAKRS